MERAQAHTQSAEATSILVVDDEQSLREMLSIKLRREGYAVEVAPSGDLAIAKLKEGARYALVLTDLKMPGASGLDVLREVKRVDLACQVLLMTAYASAETAIEAIRAGAHGYLQKPFELKAWMVELEKARRAYELARENLYLKDKLDRSARTTPENMIGSSEPMQRVYEMIRRVAETRTRVLIMGESGTGKELVARAIHDQSAERDGPFLPINCGAIPEQLIESELFGHKKGAFTGAISDKKGLFEAAHSGTVFLDEVGELPLGMQVKLLRVLEERRVRPVGSVAEVEIDCRIVSATNRDLQEEVREGRFREDLYFRLNIVTIELPALRERDGDVRQLIEHFVGVHAKRMDKDITGVEAGALRTMLNYSYPGNVRELQNVIERAVTLERGEMISRDVLPYHLLDEPFEQVTQDIEIPEEGIDLEAMVAQFERTMLIKALERTGGVRTEAAKLLGLKYRAMRHRLDKYGID
ncbi:MAG: sigma-54 dependent transcriptional regulator [Myxococcota bacterium]